MRTPLAEQVVIITGAYQEIGRATALEMARGARGSSSSARNEEAPRQALVDEIEAGGGEAEWVVADVADSGQVRRIGSRAIERFGRVNTWINDAAVACTPLSSS